MKKHDSETSNFCINNLVNIDVKKSTHSINSMMKFLPIVENVDQFMNLYATFNNTCFNPNVPAFSFESSIKSKRNLSSKSFFISDILEEKENKNENKKESEIKPLENHFPRKALKLKKQPKKQLKKQRSNSCSFTRFEKKDEKTLTRSKSASIINCARKLPEIPGEKRKKLRKIHTIQNINQSDKSYLVNSENKEGNSSLNELFKLTSNTLLDMNYKIGDKDDKDRDSGKFYTKKRRKCRTAFSTNQINQLEYRFLYQKYLTPHDRDQLAKNLSLSTTQVITWFQNRRAKLKRDIEEIKTEITSIKPTTEKPEIFSSNVLLKNIEAVLFSMKKRKYCTI